jgi:hypothetical protein
MVHSLTLAVTTDSEHLTCSGLSISEPVPFGSLSLSPKGSDLGVVFMGTTCSRSPSLCTILQGSTKEFYKAPRGEGCFGCLNS